MMRVAAWLWLLFIAAGFVCLLTLLGSEENETTRAAALGIPAMVLALRDAVRSVLKT